MRIHRYHSLVTRSHLSSRRRYHYYRAAYRGPRHRLTRRIGRLIVAARLRGGYFDDDVGLRRDGEERRTTARRRR